MKTFCLRSRFLSSRGARCAAARGADHLTRRILFKVQWGHQQEFLQLFLKTTIRCWQKIVENGRMLSVKIETPAYTPPRRSAGIIG